MTQMRPTTFPNKANEHVMDRENEVFELLARNLPDDAIVLYEPSLFDKRKRQRKPDFVLFWQQTDCVVFEVKNWNPKSILHGDGLKVYLKGQEGDTTTQTKHPHVQAKDYMHALWDHIRRDSDEESNLLDPERGKVNFCVTPVVIMLNHKEEDLPGLCEIIGGMQPEFIISEEALRDPDLLRRKLRELPFTFGPLGEKNTLFEAADLLRPADLSEEELQHLAQEKAVEILPAPAHKLTPAPEIESDVDMYNRLRGELCAVSGDAMELIRTDAGEKSPHVLKLSEVMKDLENDELKIGLFGVTAAGKSTFINALLGEQVMRPGLGETSKTITMLRAPTEDHAHGTSTLHFKTLEDLDSETVGYLMETEFLTDNDFESFTVRDASTREVLAAWFIKKSGRAARGEESARKFIQALVSGWDAYGPKLGTIEAGEFMQVDQALHDRKNGESMAVFVKERRIYHDNPFTAKGFVFIDSPGVGSSLSRHTQVAEETARKVDTAILLSKVDYKFMPADREFARRVLDSRRKQTSGLLCVLNRIGEINPLNEGKSLDQFDECVDEECDKLRERLEEEDLGDLPIFPVDSKCAFYAKRVLRDDCSDEERSQYARSAITDHMGSGLPDPEKNLRASGFPGLEADLYRHLIKVKYRAVTGRRLRDLEDACEVFREDIQAEIGALDMSIYQLNDSLEKHRENRKAVRRQLDAFMLVEFPKQVEAVYEDMDTRIDNLINEASEETKRSFQDNYIGKMKVSLKRFVTKEVIPPIEQNIPHKIRRIRMGYEARYETIKERLINEEIPEMVQKYGEGMSWAVKVDRLRTADPSSVKILSKVTPGIWQRLWAHLSTWVWDKDTRAEKLAEFLRTNFWVHMDGPIRENLTEWIEEDREECTAQVQKIFEDMADVIENRIHEQIAEVESKESERETRSKQLVHYGKQIERLLEQCKELREQVRRVGGVDSQNP